MGVVRKMTFWESAKKEATQLDQSDSLRRFRDQFLFPETLDQSGKAVYLCGNSLGLQPKKARPYIEQELADWAKLGVEGHLKAKNPWLPYHELLTEQMAKVVGALPAETVMMNTLTTNLHLMMVSFYRPIKERNKILIEASAFPSDQYAVDSQIRFHRLDPTSTLIEAKPRAGESTIRPDDLLELIHQHGSELALVLVGNVNYLTGQAFDMRTITEAAHKQGALVGFDLAHGAGNLNTQLHDVGADFAVWCGYKYLNGGPGALAGCFIHERHIKNFKGPRFAGWWGHNKKERFKMAPVFDAIPTAEGWQLSNPPIFQLAALRASLEIFDQAGILELRKKSLHLTGFMEKLLREAHVEITTPSDPTQRGCQLSLRFRKDPKKLQEALIQKGIICDFREPDIVRAAPAPLYNSFEDVYRFVEVVQNVTSR